MSEQSSSPAPDVVPENTGDTDDLRALVEKNIKWTQLVYEQNKRIQRKLRLMALWGYFKLFIIVVPIVLGFVFFQDIIDAVYEAAGPYIGISANAERLQEVLTPEQLQSLFPGKE